MKIDKEIKDQFYKLSSNKKEIKKYLNYIESLDVSNRVKLNKNDSNFVYYEFHHIIPRSLCKTINKKDFDKHNTILVTAGEHWDCHKLIRNIFPDFKNGYDFDKSRSEFIKLRETYLYKTDYNRKEKETTVKRNKKIYEGKIIKNIYGNRAKIIEYIGTYKIKVQFYDKYKTIIYTSINVVKRGQFSNPNIKNKYNACSGYINDLLDIDYSKEYMIWGAMIKRACDKLYKKNKPTYKDVTVCKEWKIFRNFYNWIIKQSNYKVWKEAPKYSFALDKDIIIKGNREYGPKACCLVPSRLNSQLLLNKSIRGDLPIGIVGKEGHYLCQYDKLHKKQVFKTKEEAFLRYKHDKEDYVKIMAISEYQQKRITYKCMSALMKWTIDIND